jgi:hypothetical protein
MRHANNTNKKDRWRNERKKCWNGTWDGEAAATGMPQASVVPVVPTVAAPPVGAVRKSDFTYTYTYIASGQSV